MRAEVLAKANKTNPRSTGVMHTPLALNYIKLHPQLMDLPANARGLDLGNKNSADGAINNGPDLFSNCFFLHAG